jgi:hypothetical protein
MSEKLPAARMNKTERSSIERLTAHLLEVAGKETLNDASSRFASYLRVFGNFFERHAAKSHWGAAQLSPACCVRFATVPASMAFV